MEEYSLIANTGIQMFTLSLEIDKEDKFKSWFHEWYDKDEGKYKLEPVLELRFDDDEMDPSYYSKPELYKMSLLGDIDKLDKKKLEAYGINPLPELCEDEEDGDNCGLFNISYTSDNNNTISIFEDKLIPLHYFI